MTEPCLRISLPDRWAVAAEADPWTDQALLRLINSCRTSASINEAALLKGILQYAYEIDAGTTVQVPPSSQPRTDEGNA